MASLKSNAWSIAFRENKNHDVLPDKRKPFRLVRNPLGGWAADPFLFEHEGTLYLFAELFSELKRRGEIGYCIWNGTRFGRWKKVLKAPYSLSYPLLMREGDEIYMCPESLEANNARIYRAARFPDSFEPVDPPLLDELPCADTTFYRNDDGVFGLTYLHWRNPAPLLLFKIEDGKAVMSECNPVSTDRSSARPGGHGFMVDGRLVRVSQDCEGEYGKGLVFSELTVRFPRFDEKELMRWYPDELVLEGFRRPLTGMHTYNANDRFEVIDIHYRRFNALNLLSRVMRKLRGK